MEFLSPFHGLFVGPQMPWFITATALVFLTLSYRGARLGLWTVFLFIALAGFGVPAYGFWILAAFALIFNTPPLRRMMITRFVMKAMKDAMPKISETERVALEAGVVWIERDFFSGKPDYKKILREVTYPVLTAQEKAFMEGPVERLCEAVDDWKVWQERELPEAAWQIMKKEKFFGMIIPKKYGGLEFSALANSEVIAKLAGRSTTACVTVMVPNSLGPAELLKHYGTDEQRSRLLPKLATGEEMPCFALTEPTAGSDAASLTSSGKLFKGDDGRLYLRLNWKKRWITLASISTTLGLAFRLYDPDNFLGKGNDVGITCALIPSKTKGVVLGNRHDPLGLPFYNCPTEGHDVVVDAEQCIVGGTKWAGRGWEMLMESLGAGRGISLPAQCAGGAKFITRVVSAHASIRKQFGVAIGKFEGVEEPLARIAGFNYLLEAARHVTVGAIDQGIKPPVITAISKYFQTELSRKMINDGMDILGGQGISRGPRNLLANGYIGTPIVITVEGANIMTRTLMIFGQGALRAHPYAYKEVKCLEKGDSQGFDEAFWGHVGHVVQNTVRSAILSLTRGWIAPAPGAKETKRYFKKLSWASASFAILSDIAMAGLGGTLKFREMITGRFADILSWQYLGFAILKRYEAEGRRKEDLPFVHYGMSYAFSQMQNAFDGILKNIGIPGLGWLFRGPLRWWSHLNTLGDEASDSVTHQVATLIQTDSEQRDRLTQGIFYPKKDGEQLKRLEVAFKAIKSSEAAEQKIRKAVHKKILPKGRVPQLMEEAFKKGIITEVELADLKRSQELRLDATTVDEFTQEEYLAMGKGRAVSSKMAMGA